MKRAGMLILFWGSLLAFASGALGAEPFQLAYVDMQRALNYCQAGREAKRQITQEVEKLQKTFMAKQKELEKIKEDLEKRSAVMSEPVRKDKERDYQTKLRDLQRLQRDAEEEIRGRDRELTDRILKRLETIIKKIGEDRKYTLILEKNQPTIIYISGALDLTEEVIKIIDQQK